MTALLGTALWALLIGQAAPPVSAKFSTELLRASERGDAATVRVLLKRGASPNAAREEGNTFTALMLAAMGGHTQVLRILIPAGADVNRAASVAAGSVGVNEGVTALMLACGAGHVNAVKVLLDAGANPNARAVFKTGEEMREAGFRSVAMHASSGAVLQLLGERGADLQVRDANGATLLFFAADADAVTYLIKKGVDPKARNRAGETALDAAKRDRKMAVTKALTGSQ